MFDTVTRASLEILSLLVDMLHDQTHRIVASCNVPLKELSTAYSKLRRGLATDRKLHRKLLVEGWFYLKGQASSGDHGIAIACAGVSRSGREVGSAITTGGQHCVGCTETVDGAVLHAEGYDPSADALLVHNQVQSKVLHCKRGKPYQGMTTD